MNRSSWYENKEVLFEIIKQMRYRETAFKVVPEDDSRSIMIRFLKCFTIDYFNKCADRFDFYKRPSNLYKSLATYSHQPVMSFNIHKRREQREAWNNEYKNFVTGLDLGMDFDSKDIGEAYLHTKGVKKVLDDFGVGYTCKFSGSKGFHIRIPYENMPKMVNMDEQSLLTKEILETLHYEHKASTLDLSVFDILRVFKVGWTWDVNTDLIALPLNDYMFDKFTTSMCRPQYIFDNFSIRDTKLYERHLGKPKDELVANTVSWIEYINDGKA